MERRQNDLVQERDVHKNAFFSIIFSRFYSPNIFYQHFNFCLRYVDDTIFHTAKKYDKMFYYDGAPTQEEWKSWPFEHPFHLILNLAVHGDVDESAFEEGQVMEVDWVRVYSQ